MPPIRVASRTLTCPSPPTKPPTKISQKFIRRFVTPEHPIKIPAQTKKTIASRATFSEPAIIRCTKMRLVIPGVRIKYAALAPITDTKTGTLMKRSTSMETNATTTANDIYYSPSFASFSNAPCEAENWRIRSMNVTVKLTIMIRQPMGTAM